MEDADVSGTSNSTAERSESDGRHMQLLNYGIQRSIKKCLSAVRYSKMERVLLPITQSCPELLKALHEQMTSQLHSNIMEEISSMFEEENIPTLMNNLDKIVQKTTLEPSVKAWRPSGEPALDVLPHLYSIKLKEKTSLEKILHEVEDKNRQFHEALRPRQHRLETTQKNILQESQYWQEAASAIPDDYKQHMDKFIEI